MSISEAQRRQVFADLERVLGTESAAIVMERLMAPIDWGDVARQSSVDAQFVATRGVMAQVRGEMAELRGEMAELRGEMAELRGEVQGQARRLAAINAVSVVAASMATAGLVIASSHLA